MLVTVARRLRPYSQTKPQHRTSRGYINYKNEVIESRMVVVDFYGQPS